GGKFLHRKIRGKERERARERGHARAVAANHCETDRGGIGTRHDSTSEIGDRQAFGTVRHAGQRDRAAREKKLGRTLRHYRFALSARSPLRLKSRQRRNSGVSCAEGTLNSPVIQPSSSRSGTSLSTSNVASSSSVRSAISASAKRPMIRSISRMPRCQQR